MKLIAFVQSYLATLHRDTKGATAIEYSVIAGLVAVGLVLAVGFLTDGLSDFFQSITGALPTDLDRPTE